MTPVDHRGPAGRHSTGPAPPSHQILVVRSRHLAAANDASPAPWSGPGIDRTRPPFLLSEADVLTHREAPSRSCDSETTCKRRKERESAKSEAANKEVKGQFEQIPPVPPFRFRVFVSFLLRFRVLFVSFQVAASRKARGRRAWEFMFCFFYNLFAFASRQRSSSRHGGRGFFFPAAQHRASYLHPLGVLHLPHSTTSARQSTLSALEMPGRAIA